MNNYYYFSILSPTHTLGFYSDIRNKIYDLTFRDQKVLFTKILSDFDGEVSHINL